MLGLALGCDCKSALQFDGAGMGAGPAQKIYLMWVLAARGGRDRGGREPQTVVKPLFDGSVNEGGYRHALK